jgi:glycerophosphoryl diester phosphodiesterase
MFESLHPPIIFAHRGASAHAPENTISAFELACSQGADALEIDTQLSADGQVVVFHDLKVDRTTNGQGKVSQLPWLELQSLDAGSYYSEKYRGEKIPLLDEVLETFGKKMFINIELKNYATPRDQLVEKVCQLVKAHGLEKGIILSTFISSNLKKAERILPEAPRGLLALSGWMGAWARSFGFNFGNYAALHINLMEASKAQIARVHRLGRRIHVWTVNQAEDMERLRDWGVDGIFTDDPQLAAHVYGRSS